MYLRTVDYFKNIYSYNAPFLLKLIFIIYYIWEVRSYCMFVHSLRFQVEDTLVRLEDDTMLRKRRQMAREFI